MSDERTESATPKRREEARNQGRVEKSQDFNAAIMLAAGLYLLFIFMPYIFNKLQYIAVDIFTHLDGSQITNESFLGYLTPYMNLTIQAVLPFLVLLTVIGIAVNYFQIGFLFSLQAIKPDFGKLSPSAMIKGFKRFFDLNAIVELLKSSAKMIIVGGVAYSVILGEKEKIFGLLGADMQVSLATISAIIFKMITQICIILFFIGIIDKKYQHYEFEKSMKMTKQEVKDEAKNAEGDPQVKAKIKSIQMQFALQRMASKVPKADVIVTNPTHYAVALQYDVNEAPAPRVVAKGVDYVAFKIKEIAENNKIPIIEDKPLARTLYKIVPVDGMIPAELYLAVAEILAYVYKQKNRML